MRARRRLLAALGLAGLACSQDIQPPPVRNLDRPSAIAFACYGDMRITDPDSSNQGDVVVSAQPVESCVARLRGETPEGQENIEGDPPLVPPRSYAFVLQSAKGTVGVIETETQVVIDSDPLTPGKNSIPIGTLPVGLAADASGCYMMAANAGSCDLGVLDVTSALRLGERARIARIPITNAAGELMRARPRTMVAGPQVEQVGLECPAVGGAVRPRGSLFIAYPACNLVAVVDAATGTITAGLEFGEDGLPTITDGNVSCPQECGDGSIVPPEATSRPLLGDIDAGPDAGPDAAPGPDAGPATTDDGLPRPVALDFGPDGRLYIGVENSPLVTTVTLDEAGLPSAVEQARLEGDVGVTALAASHIVEEGGELGTLGGSAGNFQFVYAVATDRTVRVIDLERQLKCDAQVDPRFLYDVRDPGFLSCMAVGDPTTPPRRPGARSPGIHMPRDAVPLDVTFALVNPSNPVGDVAPTGMVGTYAFVTTSDGLAYVINVDDDNYPDFEDEDDPMRANLVLAVPHQVRDFIGARDAVASNCQPPSAEAQLELGPRLLTPPSLLVSEERLATDKLHLMPNLRQVMCTAGDDRAAVSELDFTAPVDIREQVFPDWRSVFSEQVTVTWEGGLSRDDALTDLDGPPVRNGVVEQLETRVRLRDPNSPFCQVGAEPFDVISLLGCDPSFGDAQCGIGEVCYVHPDAPTVVPTGVCMPAGKTDQLSGLCRDFLITRRQYAARSVYAGEVTLGNRRRVLRTSPVAGCTSDEQCQEMAAYETTLPDPRHPIDLTGTPSSGYQWTCAADPTRAPAPDRCLMSCEASEDCEAGLACHQGFCIEGVIPPPECVSTVQRYTVRGSDAFIVIGDRTGYLHNRIADPESGECVAAPDANPLLIGRIPLTAPPCDSDALDALSPNPCSTTVEQAEVFAGFDLEGQRCVAGNEVLRERETSAIRFRNQAFTLHLADVATTGDAECIGDRAGELPAFSPVYPGFQLFFEIVGGFFPMFVPNLDASYPIVIEPGPDGRLWVLDEGDSSVSTFGAVFTLIPEAASDAFAVITIL